MVCEDCRPKQKDPIEKFKELRDFDIAFMKALGWWEDHLEALRKLE